MAGSTIPKAKLGKHGPLVPAQGFGLMSFASVYGLAPGYEDRFKVLDKAVELGNTFWDSSKYVSLIEVDFTRLTLH